MKITFRHDRHNKWKLIGFATIDGETYATAYDYSSSDIGKAKQFISSILERTEAKVLKDGHLRRSQ